MHLTWTPKGAERMLVGICVPKAEPLTPMVYRTLLTSRLAKMIEVAPAEDRRELRSQAMAWDSLELPNDPMAMASLLMMASEALQMQIPTTNWPVSPKEMLDDEDVAAEVASTLLSDWTAALYPS